MEKLTFAVHKGSLEEVKILLETSEKRNELSDQFKFILLCQAAEMERPEIVELFLANGFKVDLETSDESEELKTTPLLIAIRKGSADIVQQLLSAGADMSARDVCGFTAFHNALERGKVEVVKIFLDFGANVNSREFCFGNAVDEAMKLGNTKMFELIVNAGGQLTVDSQGTIDFFFEAVEKGSTTTVELLLKSGVRLDILARNGLNLLSYAARYSNANMIKLLLDRGLDINEESPLYFSCNGFKFKRLTALHHATGNPDLSIIDLLFELGFLLQLNNYFGPLHFAALNGQTEAMKKLMQHGATVHSQDRSGRIPLHYAVMGKSCKATRLLLNLGSLISTRDSYSKTALDYAAQNSGGETKVLKLLQILLDHGTFESENSRNRQMISALNFAAERQKLFCMEFFLKQSIPLDLIHNAESGFIALHQSVKAVNIPAVNMLVDYGIDINIRDSTTGMTPIHLAASMNCYIKKKMFDYLLENGAEVINTKGNNNTSTLHFAVLGEDVDIVNTILRLGADVNGIDGFKRTALHYVTNIEVLQLLIERGASITIKDYQGHTPVYFVLTKECWTAQLQEFFLIICKLHCNGVRTIADQDLELIASQPAMKSIFEQCCEELKSMKSEKIANTIVSLNHVVQTNCEDKLAGYARNKKIASYFRSNGELIGEKYPRYRKMLIGNYRKGRMRVPCLHRAKDFFSSLEDRDGKKLPNLPKVFVDKVFKCLSNNELYNLTKASTVRLRYGTSLP